MLTALTLAEEIAADLRRGASKGDVLRLVRQYVMDAESDPAASIAAEPRSTGDAKWDALVAGVAEDIAFRYALPTPGWVRRPDRTLAEWWFVTDFDAMRPQALVETPAALATHGVFMRRASLVNV